MPKTASAQEQLAYRILSGGESLSAKELACILGIVPNSVYRLMSKLILLGLAEKVSGTPARYRVVPAQTALTHYLLKSSRTFKQDFGISASPTASSRTSPNISLITSRASLLARAAQDVRNTRQSVNIIVSGHELPADLNMVHQQAIGRGVKVRRIVHQADRRDTFENKLWQQMGGEVRYLPDLDIRLLIYDRRVVYFASYDMASPKTAFGVRIEYEPLGTQMLEVFEQNWYRAHDIRKYTK